MAVDAIGTINTVIDSVSTICDIVQKCKDIFNSGNLETEKNRVYSIKYTLREAIYDAWLDTLTPNVKKNLLTNEITELRNDLTNEVFCWICDDSSKKQVNETNIKKGIETIINKKPHSPVTVDIDSLAGAFVECFKVTIKDNHILREYFHIKDIIDDEKPRDNQLWQINKIFQILENLWIDFGTRKVYIEDHNKTFLFEEDNEKDTKEKIVRFFSILIQSEGAFVSWEDLYRRCEGRICGDENDYKKWAVEYLEDIKDKINTKLPHNDNDKFGEIIIEQANQSGLKILSEFKQADSIENEKNSPESISSRVKAHYEAEIKEFYNEFKGNNCFINVFLNASGNTESSEDALDFIEKWYNQNDGESRGEDSASVLVISGKPKQGKTTMCRKLISAYYKGAWLPKARAVIRVKVDCNGIDKEKDKYNIENALYWADSRDKKIIHEWDTLFESLILLDEVDEVRNKLEEDYRVNDLARYIEEFAGEYNLKVIVTSRTLFAEVIDSTSIQLASITKITSNQRTIYRDNMIGKKAKPEQIKIRDYLKNASENRSVKELIELPYVIRRLEERIHQKDVNSVDYIKDWLETIADRESKNSINDYYGLLEYIALEDINYMCLTKRQKILCSLFDEAGLLERCGNAVRIPYDGVKLYFYSVGLTNNIKKKDYKKLYKLMAKNRYDSELIDNIANMIVNAKLKNNIDDYMSEIIDINIIYKYNDNDGKYYFRHLFEYENVIFNAIGIYNKVQNRTAKSKIPLQTEMCAILAKGNFSDSSDGKNGLLLEGVELDGEVLNHEHAELDGAQINNAILGKMKLKEAFLRNVNFDGSMLTDVEMSGSLLIEANFHSAVLEKVSFVNADLSGAIFRGAKLTEVDFEGSKMGGTNLGEAEVWNGVNLAGARLDEFVLDGIMLEKEEGAEKASIKVNFTSTHLANSKISNLSFSTECILNGTVFEGTTLSNIDFCCDLIGVKFTDATLVNIQVKNNKSIQGAVLERTKMGEKEKQMFYLAGCDVSTVVVMD